MLKICPTCFGKGSINDPQINGAICYSGPNGESCPQVICRTCGSTGWVEEYEAKAMTNPFVVKGWDWVDTKIVR